MRLDKKIIYFLVFSASVSFSQNVKDSLLFAPLVNVSFSLQLPGGDMAKRFGPNGSAGFGFSIKTKKNIIYGVGGGYLFGQVIKEELFKNIDTPDGYIIGTDGSYANITTHERGMWILPHAGKVFPAWGPNKNSGIISTLGLGYLQHKIRIEASDNVPQLLNDYKKGYDKLTSGIAAGGFLGYLFLANNRMVNFYAGFEFIQAFTTSRRSYDFDLMARDTKTRTDLLYGFRIGWILPLYKKLSNEFYYY